MTDREIKFGDLISVSL